MTTINAEHVREQLVARLELAGMSHSELGRRAGFDQTAVSNFIAGRRATLGLEYIEAAAAALGIARHDLTGEPPLADVRMIEIRLIRPSDDNPRRDMDPEALAELESSIVERGILQNLVVRADPNAEGRWIAIAGHRRLKAASNAVAGGKLAEDFAAPCRVRAGDETEALTEALIENLHREDMHPLDEGEAYDKLRSWLQVSAAEVARRVGKEPRYVQQRLALIDKLIPAVLEAYREGKLNFTQARAFTQGEADIQADVLPRVLESSWMSDPVTIERTIKREQEAKEHLAANPPPPPPTDDEKAEAERLRAEEAAGRAEKVKAAQEKQAEEEADAYRKSNQFNALFRANVKGDLELVARKALRDLLVAREHGRGLQSGCIGTLPGWAHGYASSLLGIEPPVEGETEATFNERAFPAIEALEDGKASTILLQLILGTARPAQVRTKWAGYSDPTSFQSTYHYWPEVETEASRALCAELKVAIPADLMPKPPEEPAAESADEAEETQVDLEEAIAAASTGDDEEAA